MRIPSFCIALSACLVHGPSAHAQFAVTVLPSVIGNTIGNMAAADTETACMSGARLPDNEIIEARDPSSIMMQRYFEAAQSGGLKSAAFHLDGKTHWTDGSSTADMTNLDSVFDPLPAKENIFVTKPLRFYRSFRDPSALGQWMVQDVKGGIVGIYTALFARKAGVWKLRNLNISRIGDKVQPVMPFCHVPGDVTEFRLRSTRLFREQTEKRLTKARGRWETAMHRAEASEAKGGVASVSTDQTSANLAAKQVAKLETVLANARKAEEDAEENARLVERLTVDATDAMAFIIAI